MNRTIAAQIARLPEMPVSELRKKYQALFEGSACRSSNKSFLVRRIAWKIQEQAYGGLPETAIRQLEALVQETDPVNRRRRQARSSGKDQQKRPRRDRRLPMPGTVLMRDYHGRELSVTVLEKGFEFEGQRYRSLSAIAREVTGTQWNGLLFFNLA